MQLSASPSLPPHVGPPFPQQKSKVLDQTSGLQSAVCVSRAQEPPTKFQKILEESYMDIKLKHVPDLLVQRQMSSVCAAEAEETCAQRCSEVINKMGDTVTHLTETACLASKFLHKRGEESPRFLGRRSTQLCCFQPKRAGSPRRLSPPLIWPKQALPPMVQFPHHRTVLQLTPQTPRRPSQHSVKGLARGLRGS